MIENYRVVVAAGSYRDGTADVHFDHRWTSGGVSVDCPFTGAHLLHLAAAGCVLNDVYREADRLGLTVAGVQVRATGGFDPDSWSSTGVEYAIEVDSPEPADRIAALLQTVDEVAEIPRAIRSGAPVRRV